MLQSAIWRRYETSRLNIWLNYHAAYWLVVRESPAKSTAATTCGWIGIRCVWTARAEPDRHARDVSLWIYAWAEHAAAAAATGAGDIPLRRLSVRAAAATTAAASGNRYLRPACEPTTTAGYDGAVWADAAETC